MLTCILYNGEKSIGLWSDLKTEQGYLRRLRGNKNITKVEFWGGYKRFYNPDAKPDKVVYL